MLSPTASSSAVAGGDESLPEIAGDSEPDIVFREGEPERDRRRTLMAERKRKTKTKKKKDLPPPIPSLARTEDPPEHMPSVMKRYYTRDGRLILREETMRHHEYFKAHRSNGRLTLQLIALNDVVRELEAEGEEGEGNECGEEHGIACSSVTSQPSIKCLDSRGLGIEVPVPEMIPPVQTL